MAALIDAINIKRKTLFEFEGAPYYCMDAEVSTPTARGGQTLVRLKMRNLLTRAVFDKTFKAGEKFADPDVTYAPASYLYKDNDGAYFMDESTYETVSLNEDQLGDALDYLIDGTELQLHKYNGNPIGVVLPVFVELVITYTEPAVKGDTSSGAVKDATLETGLVIKVPLFVKEGEKIKISTESGEFVNRV